MPAARVAAPAVNVSVAPAWPELVPATANVVLPQPLVVGVARAANVKSGNTTATLSALATAAFNSNVHVMDDAVAVTGLLIPNELKVALVGNAVDVVIAVEAMLSAPASVTPTVRVLRLANCASELVTIPLAIVTAH